MISVLFAYRPDGGQRDLLFHYVKKWWTDNFPYAEICIGTNDDEIFSRGKARNEAAKQATSDFLVIADADTIPNALAVDKAVLALYEGDQRWMLPYGPDRYYNLNRETTEVLLHRNLEDLAEPVVGYDHKITSWAGCLIMPRAAFDLVGGYDPRFIGWGYEDNAFQLALDTMWGRHGRINSYCLHLWHPVGFKTTFDQPHIEHNRNLFREYQQAFGRDDLMKEVLDRWAT